MHKTVYCLVLLLKKKKHFLSLCDRYKLRINDFENKKETYTFNFKIEP